MAKKIQANLVSGEKIKVADLNTENTFELQQTFNEGVVINSENGICLLPEGVEDKDLCTTIRAFTSGSGDDEVLITETEMKGNWNFNTNGHEVTINNVPIGNGITEIPIANAVNLGGVRIPATSAIKVDEDGNLTVDIDGVEQGEQGIPGVDGVDGKSNYELWIDEGNTGSVEEYLEWAKGEKGDTGEQGEKGDTGAQGQSAYQTAVEYGVTSTAQEWVEGLKGETGAQGIQGEQGLQGEQGIPGQDGIQGEKGETGDPLVVSYSYDSVPLMEADFDNVDFGKYAIISDNLNTDSEGNPLDEIVVAEAGYLYMRSDSEWTFILDLRGTQGVKGEKGDTGAQGVQGIQGIQGIQGEQGVQGIQGEKGDKGEDGAKGDKLTFEDLTEDNKAELKGEKGDTGATGATGGNNLYSLTISTQEQFEELLASDTWLGATSIAFVGDGGLTSFVREDGAAVVVPTNVKVVDFFNEAHIHVKNFLFAVSGTGCFCYATLPPENEGYSMSNVRVTGESGASNSITTLRNVRNVNGATIKTISTSTSGGSYGAQNIINCTNLDITVTSTAAISYIGLGLYNCSNIKATITATVTAYGLASSQACSNITATLTGATQVRAFNSCSECSNARITIGTTITSYGLYGSSSCSSMTFIGTGTTTGYVYYGSSFLSSIRSSTTPKTSYAGGTNTYIGSSVRQS